MSKKKRKGRPRNNISILPWEIREKIGNLILDGKFRDDIRNDEEIYQSVQDHGGKRLHSTSFIAFEDSDEFKEIRKAKRNKEPYS